MTTRAIAWVTILFTVLVTSCTSDTDASSTAASNTDPPSASSPLGAEQLIAEYGWDGMNTVQIIDHLDRLAVEDRPTNLTASVRPRVLVVSSGEAEFGLDMPPDRFYLSVAPYVDQTHECFYHSLTTCKGELATEKVQVQVVNQKNDKMLVDDTRTTFANGFLGLWLPRDIEGTLRVSYGGKVGEVDFATHENAPTCLTTLRLA